MHVVDVPIVFIAVSVRTIVFSTCICGATVFWGYNAGLVLSLIHI